MTYQKKKFKIDTQVDAWGSFVEEYSLKQIDINLHEMDDRQLITFYDTETFEGITKTIVENPDTYHLVKFNPRKNSKDNKALTLDVWKKNYYKNKHLNIKLLVEQYGSDLEVEIFTLIFNSGNEIIYNEVYSNICKNLGSKYFPTFCRDCGILTRYKFAQTSAIRVGKYFKNISPCLVDFINSNEVFANSRWAIGQNLEFYTDVIDAAYHKYYFEKTGMIYGDENCFEELPF